MRRIDWMLASLFVVAGACLAMFVFCSGPFGAQPQTEDEFVYLFQAKTLLAGHLSFPSPPLPEFFEFAHILVVPRFAAKYLPGHAAVLAPFLALGVPWLAPCVMLGVTSALIFVAARRAGLSLAGSMFAALLLLGATDTFPYFASYLSQTTSMAACAAALALLPGMPTRRRLVALAAVTAFATLVRPYAGVACGAAFLVLLLRARRRDALWSLLPLAIGGLVALAVCHAMTGSWTTPPWALYAKQYMPYDGPGIGAVHAPPPTRGLPAHLRELYDGFLDSRLKHTWARLPSETLRRLMTTARLLPSLVLAPFALIGLFLAPGAAFAVVFFLEALTFHVGGTVYHLELAPFLAVAAACGVELVVREAMRSRYRVALMVALSLPALWLATSMGTELGLIFDNAPKRGWLYARWEPAFRFLREQHALVFIHYPPGWDGNIDLTVNDPDLGREQLVRAIDRGPHDAELLPYFPDRPAFVLDASTLQLTRLR